ncbi:MAG: S-layer homology domain-containing protein, partial [Lachnospiraceae bacterium]|nr:S-layer homology domain-containing protein [Lachnospiraceae bacterium]
MKRRKLAALILSLAMVTGTVLSPMTAAGENYAAEETAAEFTEEEVSGEYEDLAEPEEEASEDAYADEEVSEDAYADDDTEAADDAAEVNDAEYADDDAGYADDDADYEADDAADAELQEAAESDVESLAEAVEGEEDEKQGGSLTFDEGEFTNDELFQKYIDSQMFETDEAALANYGETKFKNSKYTLKLYRALKSKLKTIGQKGGSTVFTVSFTVTTADGYKKSVIEKINRTGYPADSWLGNTSGNAAKKMFSCLLNDVPYELYWFDKTTGFSITNLTTKMNSAHTSVTVSMKFTFYVASGYASNSARTSVKTNVSKVKTAATKAKSIVSKYTGKSDYEKLVGYKTEICKLTDYNYNAIYYNYAYGDPWQLIDVFDGDPSTKVVCEGYSKAFQYLCDLSSFADKNTKCYIVTGDMDGGAHMWNVVRWNGKSYLVDVTNTDTDNKEYLFMVSDVGSDKSYTIRTASYGSTKYTYDSDTIDLYSSAIRKLGTDRAYKYKDNQDSSKFFYYPVMWALTKGITSGVTTSQFKPDATVTRAQMITFLYRMAGSPNVSAKNRFRDVKDSAFYAKAVTWAVNKGITTGTSYNYFSPDKPCTRGQIMTFLYRSKGSPSASTYTRFYDVSSSDFYAKAVNWAVSKGITDGT